ncbi:hypothetical protein ACLI1A_10190 [Flavobacterium sp. RHBU_3]|uniref:hypothetical protein n=1 Tax=Flavobacterium sp. RHBU_3 TaxID=3391184 RepID=UPI00398491B4
MADFTEFNDLNSDVQQRITDKTGANSISKADVGDSITDLSSLTKAKLEEVADDVSTKADIDSPVFTGDAKVPTAPSGDNDESVANTAFVVAAIDEALQNLPEQPLYANMIAPTTTAPYPELIYDINNLTSDSGSVRVPDPATTNIGHTLYVRTSVNTLLRSYDNTAKLSVGATNAFNSSVTLAYNKTYRLMHLGSGVWQVEYVNGGQYAINGIPADGMGNFNTAIIDGATTEPLTKAMLNSTYYYLSFPPGTRVYCISMTGGPVVYERMDQNDWASQPITLVS